MKRKILSAPKTCVKSPKNIRHDEENSERTPAVTRKRVASSDWPIMVKGVEGGVCLSDP